MISLVHGGGFTWLRVLAPALAAAIACAGGDGGGGEPSGASVRERPKFVAPAVTPSLPMSDGGTSVGALTCADPTALACRGTCCPAGSTCVAGECHVPVDVQDCPAEAPVPCDSAVSCAWGCAALDHSGRGNHLTVLAPAGFGEGYAGGGLYINRATYAEPGILVFGSGADLALQNATVEVWFRPGPYSFADDWQVLYAHGSRVLMVKPRAVAFSPCEIGLGSLRLDGTGDPLGTGTGWHFLAVSIEASIANVYLDARRIATCPVGGPAAFPDAGSEARVGTNAHSTAPGSKLQFQGAIDELRILDVPRSEPDLMADYLLARLPVIPGTRALWRFDEGARRRCCAADASCGPGGRCETPLTPPTCGGGVTCDAWCCPGGTACGAGGCVVGGAVAGCEVTCGDGSCCPAGWGCGASGGCVLDPGTTPTSPCPAGEIAFDRGDGFILCCGDPGPGYLVDWTGSGACNGCYIVGGDTGNCAPGYSPCSQEAPAKCIRGPTSAQVCTGGIICGGNSHDRIGGCCSAGSTCIPTGLCCDPGEVVCGDGCCSSADACSSGVCTRARTEPCPIPCGGLCCQDGETCSGGTCIAPPQCPTGIPCGAICCVEGDRCASPGECERAPDAPPGCPPELPVACGGGIGCCPAGHACPTWSGDVCRHEGPLPETSGPTGPRCSDTTACAAGQVCTGAGCCPADHPLACGTSCCLPGATCVDGACACPDGRLPCDGTCCGSGMSCRGGACTADCEDPAFPLTCGESCCGEGLACVSGGCACRGDHPVECGDGCCLAGASCGASGCGCPESKPTSCGDYCCAPGQRCLQCPGQSAPSCRDSPCPLNCPSGSHQSGDVCVCETPGHSVKACPGGSQKCCLNDMVCCYSQFGGPADCSPSAFCAN